MQPIETRFRVYGSRAVLLLSHGKIQPQVLRGDAYDEGDKTV
jgi:hypothetical protein